MLIFGSLMPTNALLIFLSSQVLGATRVDNFDSDPRTNPWWQFYAPVPGVDLSIREGWLRVTIPPGGQLDIWGGSGNATQLRHRTASGDFIAETHLRFLGSGDPGNPTWPPAEEGYQAAITVSFPSDDIYFWGPYQGTPLQLDQSGGDWRLCYAPSAPREVSLQITKIDTSYSFSWRANDSDPWTLACTLNRNMIPTYVGLLFKNWANNSLSQTFEFDYFSFTSVGADRDNDGIDDIEDNCPDRANADQMDADNDGKGDACDNCPLNANVFQSDRDSDGIGDICDNCPLTKNPGQEDSDGNGLGDSCEWFFSIAGDTELSLCNSAIIDILLTNPDQVEGLSFGLAHDSGVVLATQVTPAPVWSGSTPEFLAVNLNASGTGAECDSLPSGITVAMVGRPTNPAAGGIPASSSLRIASVEYQQAKEGIGDQANIELVECLLPAIGSPPTLSSLTVRSNTIIPGIPGPWHLTTVAGNCRKRGYCNNDSRYDISDPVALLSLLFSSGDAPSCEAACDANGDRALDISDGIFMLGNLFLGGPYPNPPYADCDT